MSTLILIMIILAGCWVSYMSINMLVELIERPGFNISKDMLCIVFTTIALSSTIMLICLSFSIFK